MKDVPLLASLRLSVPDTVDHSQYPFNVPLIQNLKNIEFPNKVTFFVGENGTGKSTILEAIALKAGFGPEGGSRNISFKTTYDNHYTPAASLADCMTFSWRKKATEGYFFRAESFFNVASQLEKIAKEGGQGPEKTYAPYGGKSLHEQSHGESFLAFFKNRLSSGGFFVFDEPEAAFSPQRQLSLLSIIHELSTHTDSQFIIATHSPIILAYPSATIYSCDSEILKTIHYKDTSHYQITKHFLDNPDRYLKHLFAPEKDQME